MKTQKIKKCMSLFLAALMCVTTLFGVGTTAYAAEETDEVCLVSFPRDGDANYGGEWGHGSFNFMNGWSSGSSRYTTVRAMGSYDGNICYCIEPGVPQDRATASRKRARTFGTITPRPIITLFRPMILSCLSAVSFSTAIRVRFRPLGVHRMRAATSWLTLLPHSF